MGVKRHGYSVLYNKILINFLILTNEILFFSLGSAVRLVTFEMCIKVIRLMTIEDKTIRIKDEHLAMLQVLLLLEWTVQRIAVEFELH